MCQIEPISTPHPHSHAAAAFASPEESIAPHRHRGPSVRIAQEAMRPPPITQLAWRDGKAATLQRPVRKADYSCTPASAGVDS